MMFEGMDKDDFNKEVDEMQEALGEENCNIFKKQLTEPDDKINLKIANFAAFEIDNPMKMSPKKTQYLTIALADFSGILKKQKKGGNDEEDSILNLEEKYKKIIKIFAGCCRICGVEVDENDEYNRIYEVDFYVLVAIANCLLGILRVKAKNSSGQNLAK